MARRTGDPPATRAAERGERKPSRARRAARPGRRGGYGRASGRSRMAWRVSGPPDGRPEVEMEMGWRRAGPGRVGMGVRGGWGDETARRFGCFFHGSMFWKVQGPRRRNLGHVSCAGGGPLRIILYIYI